MNVLYLHTHDTGRLIEPYGYGVPTPNLQYLAQTGTLFRNAYCAAPTCSPSRAAMLTGMNAHASGVTGLVHRGFALNDKQKHLANFLSQHGFDTALCGVQHETHSDPGELGYQHVFTEHPYNPDDFEMIDSKTTDDAISWLKNPHDKPFFLSIGFVNTHRDFPKVKHPVNSNYTTVPAGLPDNKQTREDFGAFIDSAKIVDRCCGQIFAALDELQLWDDTIVFFTTDHGAAFPRMKCTLYDAGIGVSLIIRYPSNQKTGGAIDAMVSQLDIYPTLCELLNLDIPEWLEGCSLLPLFNNTADAIHDAVFAEVSYHAAYEPMRCIRTDRYKLIRRFDDYGQPILCNIDDGISKELLLKHNLAARPVAGLELYDLIYDPAEQHNLAEAPEYQELINQLNNKLSAWMQETKDPLLGGKIVRPDGARINCQDCLRNTDSRYETISDSSGHQIVTS